MNVVTHPILGTIDSSKPGFWEGTLHFGTREVDIDLTVDDGTVEEERLAALLGRLDTLGELDQAARVAIERDSEEGDDSAAAVYANHHRDELTDKTLESLFGTHERKRIASKTVLSKLELVRVGLYPESEEGHLLLDYSIGPEFTHYLLCVSFDSDGEVSAVDLES